jgi:hypothetical protein
MLGGSLFAYETAASSGELNRARVKSRVDPLISQRGQQRRPYKHNYVNKGGNMTKRQPSQQSEHDAAVVAAAEIYRDHGKYCWINPNGEKNKLWAGYYIDVMAAENKNSDKAWVIEIDPKVGLLTSLGIILHEVPEGVTSFSLLIGPIARNTALKMSIAVALATPLGALVSLAFIGGLSESTVGLLLARGNLLNRFDECLDLIPL